MSVAVVVPRRPDGGGPRDQAWAALESLWRETFPGWDLRTGEHLGGPWSKAEATRAALDGSGADVLVVADADVWLDPPGELARAVALVMTGRRSWVVPHNMVIRLSEAGTEAWLGGERESLALDQSPYRGIAGGGLIVISRAGWETVGGFDPRFVGWGQEDVAFGVAADTLLGRHDRGRGRLWHLWHPPAERRDRVVGSDAGAMLLAAYRAARRDRVRMGEVVAGGQDPDDRPGRGA